MSTITAGTLPKVEAPSRRDVLKGIAAGATVAAAATALAQTGNSTPEVASSQPLHPLYRRTKEIEQYYKTLYY